jgi:uncharacterized delta-60 repeat protein
MRHSRVRAFYCSGLALLVAACGGEASVSAPNGTDGGAGTGQSGSTGASGAAGASGVDGGAPSPRAARLDIAPDLDDYLLALNLDANGKIVATGGLRDDGGSFMIARIDPETLDLDASFGANGYATLDALPGGPTLHGTGIATRSDGYHIVVGDIRRFAAGDQNVFVVRYTPSGSLDLSFGDGGARMLDLSAGDATHHDEARDVAVDASGRIIVLALRKAQARAANECVIARFDAEGIPDANFATDGRFVVPAAVSGASDDCTSLALRDEGTIFALGTSTQGAEAHALFTALDAAGAPLAGFGVGGVVRSPIAGEGGTTSVAWGLRGADGRLFLGGQANVDLSRARPDAMVLAFDANGGVLSSFAGTGRLMQDVASHEDLLRGGVLLADGRSAWVGSGQPTAGAADALLMVVDGAGAPDRDVGTGGLALFDLGGNREQLQQAARREDGRRVAAVGFTENVGAQGPREDRDSVVMVWDVR